MHITPAENEQELSLRTFIPSSLQWWEDSYPDDLLKGVLHSTQSQISHAIAYPGRFRELNDTCTNGTSPNLAGASGYLHAFNAVCNAATLIEYRSVPIPPPRNFKQIPPSLD